MIERPDGTTDDATDDTTGCVSINAVRNGTLTTITPPRGMTSMAMLASTPGTAIVRDLHTLLYDLRPSKELCWLLVLAPHFKEPAREKLRAEIDAAIEAALKAALENNDDDERD